MEILLCIVLAIVCTLFQLSRLKNVIKGKERVKIYYLIPLSLMSLLIFIWLCFDIWSGTIPLHILYASYYLIMLTVTEIIGYIKQPDQINN